MSKRFDWRSTAHRVVPTTDPDGYQRVFGVKVREEKPPIYDNACAAFQVNPRTVFTYGDTVYNPHKIHLPEDLIEHEKVHIGQQKDAAGAALWWGKYLRDEMFRFDQEINAYARQYAFICQTVTDQHQRHRILGQMSRTLSGPLYGLTDFTRADESRVMIVIRAKELYGLDPGHPEPTSVPGHEFAPAVA